MSVHFEKVFKWAKFIKNENDSCQSIQILPYYELKYNSNQFDSESEALSVIHDLNNFSELVLLTVYQRVWSEE